MTNNRNLTEEQYQDLGKVAVDAYYGAFDPNSSAGYVAAGKAAFEAAPYLRPDLQKYGEELLDKFIAKFQEVAELQPNGPTMLDVKKTRAFFPKKPRYAVKSGFGNGITLTCDGVATGCFFPDEATALEIRDYFNSKEDSK